MQSTISAKMPTRFKNNTKILTEHKLNISNKQNSKLDDILGGWGWVEDE